jgi:hypothetical protein
MTTVNPYYYGLVKQIGPWKTTREDILRGQKPYQYTPNEETENPYTMKSANSQLYEQYSSQGLIYDAATSPVITAQSPRSSKLKRGKVVRAKKEVKIVDPSGNIVSPTDNYFLNRYMGEMRGDVQGSIIEADLGGGRNDLAEMASPRASTATMASASSAASSAISEENMSAIPDDGPAFEDLNIFGEENVDRGAQVNDPVVNDQIDFVQNLERERIIANANVARDRWLNPDMNFIMDNQDDIDYLAFVDPPPRYENIDVEMEIDPPVPGYQQRRRRSSAASNNPAPLRRQRR